MEVVANEVGINVLMALAPFGLHFIGCLVCAGAAYLLRWCFCCFQWKPDYNALLLWGVFAAVHHTVMALHHARLKCVRDRQRQLRLARKKQRDDAGDDGERIELVRARQF